MRTQHIGPDELLIAAKVQLRPGLDTAGVAAAINQAERRIREAVSIECMIYLEPDRVRSRESIPTSPLDMSPSGRLRLDAGLTRFALLQ